VDDADGVLELVARAGGARLLHAQGIAQLGEVELGVGALRGRRVAPALGERSEGDGRAGSGAGFGHGARQPAGRVGTVSACRIAMPPEDEVVRGRDRSMGRGFDETRSGPGSRWAARVRWARSGRDAQTSPARVWNNSHRPRIRRTMSQQDSFNTAARRHRRSPIKCWVHLRRAKRGVRCNPSSYSARHHLLVANLPCTSHPV
jgi:hypothetical protein